MKTARYTFAMLVTAMALQASVIDVSSSQSTVLRGGDTLSFELFTGSYRATAQQFGLPLDPEALRFALVTAPLEAGQQFSATLRSADSSISVALADLLDFNTAYYSSAGFQGIVSGLCGAFSLNSPESQELLQSGSVWLDFKNLGSDVTIGLAPLPLQRELYVSLAGGPLSVGATNGAVLLERPVPPSGARIGAASFVATPEPGPASMILGGGGLLLGVSAMMRRFSSRRKRSSTA